MLQALTVLLIILLCLGNSLLPCVAVPTGTKCPPVKGREVETCVCQSDKGIIDLTSIASTDGNPRFSGLRDANDYMYSYNPCKSYTNGDCGDVHACQTALADPGMSFDIADGGTEEMWIDTDGTPYLIYTGPPSKSRETKAFFTCDEHAKDPIATTVGDTPPREILHYEFYVTAATACPGFSGGSSTDAGPVGFVLMSLLLVGFIAYFVIGVLIMKFHYNASGSDIVPNKSFWIQFPFLIKDGFVFTFGPCINFIQEKRRTSQGYQKT